MNIEKKKSESTSPFPSPSRIDVHTNVLQGYKALGSSRLKIIVDYLPLPRYYPL